MKKIYLAALSLSLIFIFSASLQAQVQTDSIYSQTLEQSRDFWVKLPENYDPNSAQRYPVIYLLDGFSLQSSLELVYENYWGHYLPHMILVGVSNRQTRMKDLTTSEIDNRRGAAVTRATGGAEDFTAFLEKELLPYIDQNYPTSPYRTLIGHSYAGLFTINTLLNHGDLFQNYIAIDPSLDWDNQALLKEAKQSLKTQNLQGKSLYISLAAEQLHMFDASITPENVMNDESEFTLFPRSIIEFANLAEETSTDNGLKFAWQIYPEDLHGTVPLPTMRDGLVFLFDWYQFKTPQKYNNPDTSVEELEALLKTQAEIYSQNFGYPVPPMIEELLNGYGYMKLQTGLPKHAELFFKTSIEYYPNSPNSYDSMAEYYESQNNLKKALEYAEKAAQLSDKPYFKQRVEELKNR